MGGLQLPLAVLPLPGGGPGGGGGALGLGRMSCCVLTSAHLAARGSGSAHLGSKRGPGWLALLVPAPLAYPCCCSTATAGVLPLAACASRFRSFRAIAQTVGGVLLPLASVVAPLCTRMGLPP